MQTFAALAINVAVLFVLLLAMGKIYQFGVMTVGRKPTMREVLGWMRSG